jgi:predicted transcriptional regulator
MITGKHVQAARAVLGLGVRDLAALADVSFTAINRFERGVARTTARTADKLQRAREAEGIEFLDGDRPGIRWKA